MQQNQSLLISLSSLLLAASLLLFVLFFVSCASVPDLLKDPLPPLEVSFEELLAEPDLPVNPDDGLMVSVSLGSLRRALAIAERYDALRIFLPEYGAYTVELEEGWRDWQKLAIEQRAALQWNLIIGASSAAVGGLAVGIILGFLLGAGS